MTILTYFWPIFHYVSPKTLENIWFFGVFSEYKTGALAINGLK